MDFMQLSGVPKVKFITAKCVIQCEGNSLVSGSGSTGGQNYPVILQTLAPISANMAVRNGGSAGQTIARMREYSGPITNNYWGAGKTNILIAWEGTNSILSSDATYGQRTGAQAAEEMRLYCLERLAQQPALKIILLTTLPCMGGFRGTASTNQEVDAYNAILKANYKSWGVKAIVDVRAEGTPFYMTSYSTADFNNANISPYWQVGETTHVHLNSSGYALIAAMVAAELRRLPLR